MEQKILYPETRRQNPSNVTKGIVYRVEPTKEKTVSTLQVKTKSRIEINLTDEQLKEITWLFRQYGLKKPGWLRHRFVTNQRRTKQIKTVLSEAGLDGKWCWLLKGHSDWSGILHELSHALNGGSLCK